MKAHDFPQEFASEAIKGTPPVAVTAASLSGIVDWSSWVYVLTALYLALQIFWLGWKMYDRARGKGKEGD